MEQISVWHWLIVLLALGFPGLLIYVAVSRVRAERGVMTAGFKGWLFLLAVGLWSSFLGYFKETLFLFDKKNAIYSRLPEIFWYIDSSPIIGGFLLLLVSLILMLRRSRHFPSSFIVCGAFSIVSPYFSAVLASIVLKDYGILLSPFQILEENPEVIGKWVAGTIFLLSGLCI